MALAVCLAFPYRVLRSFRCPEAENAADFFKICGACLSSLYSVFVFPHAMSITTETVISSSMRLLRSLSPSAPNTT